MARSSTSSRASARRSRLDPGEQTRDQLAVGIREDPRRSAVPVPGSTPNSRKSSFPRAGNPFRLQSEVQGRRRLAGVRQLVLAKHLHESQQVELAKIEVGVNRVDASIRQRRSRPGPDCRRRPGAADAAADRRENLGVAQIELGAANGGLGGSNMASDVFTRAACESSSAWVTASEAPRARCAVSDLASSSVASACFSSAFAASSAISNGGCSITNSRSPAWTLAPSSKRIFSR